MEDILTMKRLLTLLTAASGAALIGLGPSYANLQDEFGTVSFSSSEESMEVASIDSDELSASDDESLQLASSSDEESLEVASSESYSSEEGLAGRPGDSMESSEGLSSIESHPWSTETLSAKDD